MKKTLYILAFTFLGLIVSTLIHAGLELIALDIIFRNPEKFATTFWWTEWKMIHSLVSLVLWILGAAAGGYLGTKWWQPYGSKPSLFNLRKKL